MAEKIQLEVVTPERRVLAEPVDMVTVPGLGGANFEETVLVTEDGYELLTTAPRTFV